jgi:putative ABC transport system substrate-binding protein
MFKDALPQATRIGILWNPTTPSHPPALKAIEAASTPLGVSLHKEPVSTVEDFDGAFAAMTREHLDAFLVVASPVAIYWRARLAELALAHQLPGVFADKGNVEAGGLMSYGPDNDDLTRRAAVYIVKILNGTKPADLPVEQATKFELAVNLNTAKALGLKISESFLLRADEVIE